MCHAGNPFRLPWPSGVVFAAAVSHCSTLRLVREPHIRPAEACGGERPRTVRSALQSALEAAVLSAPSFKARTTVLRS